MAPPKDPSNRIALLQGTLDMRILRTARWEAATNQKREFKFYRLTAAGKKHLTAQDSKWKQLAGAIARVMEPAGEN